MSNQINDLLQDSQAQFRAQRNETKVLVSKWEKTGLLEGINEEYNKHNTAILLENQAKQLISEANNTGTGTAKEDWNGVALPLVRRIFGELSGLVFWLDFKYGTAKGRATTSGAGSSLFGNTTTKGAASLNNGLYSAGTGSIAGAAAGYSLAKVSGSLAGVTWTSGVADLSAIVGTDADYDTVGSWYALGDGAGGSGAGSVFEVISHTGTSVGFGLITNNSTVIVNADTNTGGALYYYKNTATAADRGDFEDRGIMEMDGTGTNLEIPELEVNLVNEALVAKTRKLKVKWSPEFAQDLNAYHSIDAEAELTSMLSEYITMEIDMEILGMLQAAAATNGFSGGTFVAPAIGSAGVTYNQLFALLGVKMQAMSNAIHQSTMRGGANFAVCSPQIATYLESIAGFAANTDGTAANFAMGVTAIGSVSNRFTIYKNPYWTGNDILMGFRGSQFLETGAVFAPYIPLIMTPLVYDPTNFTPRKGVMTRYAKKVVRNDFYGVITVDDTNWQSVGALPTA